MSVTKIATVTVGAGGAASIDFTSIPGTMTDLQVFLSVRNTGSAGSGSGRDVNISVNGGGAGVSITNRLVYGQGSGSGSSVSNSTAQVGFTDASEETANTFANTTLYIPNYAGSTAKSFSVDSVHENNATYALQMILAGLWSGTSAINRLTFAIQSGGNFAQYSTATLYGITKGSLAGVTVS